MSDPKETAYDSEIAPLMTRIIDLCKEHKINMAAQFSLDVNDEGEPLLCTTCLTPDADDTEGIERMRQLKERIAAENDEFLASIANNVEPEF